MRVRADGLHARQSCLPHRFVTSFFSIPSSHCLCLRHLHPHSISSSEPCASPPHPRSPPVIRPPLSLSCSAYIKSLS
jgi:hypothetical protein